jgi:hypothetical protein
MEAKMVTRVTVALEDDLDGGPAGETVRFRLGGPEYEIDLNTKNAEAFRNQLAPYIEHARKAGGEQRPPVSAYFIQPGAQRRHPGVGQRQRHPNQRPRPHPGKRCRAV